MTYDFYAEHISIEESLEFTTIGFADREQNTEKYILLDKAGELHPCFKPGREAYIEVYGQGRSMYGGIKKIFLTKSTLTIKFNSKGVKTLGLRQEDITITFEKNSNEVEKLKTALQKVFSEMDKDIK